MSNPPFGFYSREQERKLSEIEESVKVVFSDKNRLDSLANQGDTFMEIFFGQNSFFGIYRGTTDDGTHVIMPSIFPGEKYGDYSVPTRERNCWKNWPNYVRSPITGFRPIDRETLSLSAPGFDKVEKLGKIYEEPEQSPQNNA